MVCNCLMQCMQTVLSVLLVGLLHIFLTLCIDLMSSVVLNCLLDVSEQGLDVFRKKPHSALQVIFILLKKTAVQEAGWGSICKEMKGNSTQIVFYKENRKIV